MSFKIVYSDRVRRRIASWRLPDPILVEVYLRLGEDLVDNPAQKLKRTYGTMDGMSYWFRIVDPANRFQEYRFRFHIVYGQDEERLIVVTGGFHLISGL
jgi:hypothetical protein